MEKFSAKVFICSLFAALVLLSSPARSQEVEDESEFNYDENSDRGPSHWGDIKPEWRTCKTGKMQSPIDLNDRKVQVAKLGPLNLNYNPSNNATLKNKGHEIQLDIHEPTSSLQINGTSYTLVNLHWHIPSEHTINRQRFDLELHLVHQTPITNQIAVIGILYKIGTRSDPVLLSLKEPLEALNRSSAGASVSVPVFDPRVVDINDTKLYYRYMGSLTTPPCTEGVTWTVLKQIRSVKEEQIVSLQNAVNDGPGGNARPIQPTNNRIVQFNKYPPYFSLN
ncbi:alpha carbonic anhydrase 7 [Arachis duranensis]|uniref:Carbonic anhydrase n=1 Tax=Arachis duranensis TaxID=130453 RepID=A0A9C6TUN4_ARADU|nr:alpha carbonic anhydrase 7 [Arachis duranensis]